MSKTTLPKELEWEQQFDELIKKQTDFLHTDGDRFLLDENIKDIKKIKQFIATAVAQAEERVKQQVLELIGSDDPTHYKDVSSETRRYNEIRNELRQQLIEKVSSL